MDDEYHVEVIEAVERVIEKQRSIVYDLKIKMAGPIKGKTIAILSFKLDLMICAKFQKVMKTTLLLMVVTSMTVRYWKGKAL